MDDIRRSPSIREEMKDADLLLGLAERSEAALREVVTRYGPLVFGTAIRLLKNEVLGEEVAQDSFMVLWQRPDAVQGSKGNLASFLRGIARYKAIDVIRREEARNYRESGTASEAVLQDFAIDLIDCLDNRQKTDQALSRLSNAQKEIVILTYWGGAGCREVARHLGIPLSTAKTRLPRGRRIHQGHRASRGSRRYLWYRGPPRCSGRCHPRPGGRGRCLHGSDGNPQVQGSGSQGRNAVRQVGSGAPPRGAACQPSRLQGRCGTAGLDDTRSHR